MSLLYFVVLLEFIAAIVGSFYFKKYSKSYLKYFLLIFLWTNALWEGTVAVFRISGIPFENNFMYNIISSAQNIYLFFLYYKTLSTVKYKNIVLGFIVLFITAITVNFLFFQKLTITTAFHSNTFGLGSILLIITIGIYLIETLNTERVLQFRQNLIFWISIGLFVFYAGITPFIIYLKFMKNLPSTDITTVIIFTLNLVMYSCFIIGFIISDKYTD